MVQYVSIRYEYVYQFIQCVYYIITFYSTIVHLAGMEPGWNQSGRREILEDAFNKAES